MNHVGHLSQYPKLEAIVNAIFKAKESGDTRRDHSFNYKKKRVKVGIFYNKKIWHATLGRVLFVEQNPNTASEYATRAAAGAKIVWLILQSNQRGVQDQYIGRVEDGQVFADSGYFKQESSA